MSIDITTLTDEDCLNLFKNLMQDRITLSTSFVFARENLITHEIIVASCGELVTYSDPEPLTHPLTMAVANDVGATVN